MQEYLRVVRLGSVIRVTESEWISGDESNPALQQISQLALQTRLLAGHVTQPVADGVTTALPGLFEQHGIGKVQTRAWTLEFPTGTPAGQTFGEDVARLFHNIKPFVQKWTRLPDDYKEIYQRMLQEIAAPHFIGRMNLLTIWGTRGR